MRGIAAFVLFLCCEILAGGASISGRAAFSDVLPGTLVTGEYSCALTSSGSVECWGDYDNPSAGTRVASLLSEPFAEGAEFTQLSLKYACVCGATTAGDVFCDGLIHIPTAGVTVPAEATVGAAAGKDVSFIAVGRSYICFLSNQEMTCTFQGSPGWQYEGAYSFIDLDDASCTVDGGAVACNGKVCGINANSPNEIICWSVQGGFLQSFHKTPATSIHWTYMQVRESGGFGVTSNGELRCFDFLSPLDDSTYPCFDEAFPPANLGQRAAAAATAGIGIGFPQALNCLIVDNARSLWASGSPSEHAWNPNSSVIEAPTALLSHYQDANALGCWGLYPESLTAAAMDTPITEYVREDLGLCPFASISTGAAYVCGMVHPLFEVYMKAKYKEFLQPFSVLMVDVEAIGWEEFKAVVEMLLFTYTDFRSSAFERFGSAAGDLRQQLSASTYELELEGITYHGIPATGLLEAAATALDAAHAATAGSSAPSNSLWCWEYDGSRTPEFYESSMLAEGWKPKDLRIRAHCMRVESRWEALSERRVMSLILVPALVMLATAALVIVLWVCHNKVIENVHGRPLNVCQKRYRWAAKVRCGGKDTFWFTLVVLMLTVKLLYGTCFFVIDWQSLPLELVFQENFGLTVYWAVTGAFAFLQFLGYCQLIGVFILSFYYFRLFQFTGGFRLSLLTAIAVGIFFTYDVPSFGVYCIYHLSLVESGLNASMLALVAIPFMSIAVLLVVLVMEFWDNFPLICCTCCIAVKREEGLKPVFPVHKHMDKAFEYNPPSVLRRTNQVRQAVSRVAQHETKGHP